MLTAAKAVSPTNFPTKIASHKLYKPMTSIPIMPGIESFKSNVNILPLINSSRFLFINILPFLKLFFMIVSTNNFVIN